MRRIGAFLVAAVTAAACGGGAIVVGDDSADATEPGGETGAPEGSSPIEASTPDTSVVDATSDAPPSTTCNAPSECLTAGTACRVKDTSLACPKSSDFCCTQTCPQLTPPSPTLCDGGPFAPKYDSTGCIVGYACAPTDCVTAGGKCVGLAPGTCSTGHVGSATQYSCGGGLGVQCCLP